MRDGKMHARQKAGETPTKSGHNVGGATHANSKDYRSQARNASISRDAKDIFFRDSLTNLTRPHIKPSVVSGTSIGTQIALTRPPDPGRLPARRALAVRVSYGIRALLQLHDPFTRSKTGHGN